jgi:hypothetical protein
LTYLGTEIHVCNANACPSGNDECDDQANDIPCFQSDLEVWLDEKESEGGAKEEQALSERVKREFEGTRTDFGDEELTDVGVDGEDSVGPDSVGDYESRHVFAHQQIFQGHDHYKDKNKNC